MLSGQQLGAVARPIFVWVILASSLLFAQAPPAQPPPGPMARYKTSATATLKSLRFASSSSGIAAGLGEDIIGDVRFSVLKLRIHSYKALTAEGTIIRQDEVLEAISRESIDKKAVGKNVRVEMELRGDTSRHRWLVTKIIPASSSGTTKKE